MNHVSPSRPALVKLAAARPADAEAALRDRIAWLEGQKRAFQAAFDGEPLAVSLRLLVASSLGEGRGGARCAFYLVDAAGAELRPVPGMEHAVLGLDGFEIGFDSFACGLAAAEGRPIITPDVRRDPRWAPWLWAAEQNGYRAIWSFPMHTSAGRTVGTLAMYFGEPREATARDHELASVLTGAAAIIIVRHREAEERARAEAARRDSEERLRRFGEASQDVLWIRDAETLQWQYLTPSFEEIYGLSRDEALAGNNYGNWLDLIVPEDRGEAAASIARVRAGEHVVLEYRIRRPRDGEVRWIRNTDFPIADASGRVTLIGGIGHDATGLKRAEERQNTLLAELQHRVRNILAVTRSIISRTDDGERSTEDYVQHLQGRIGALTRTQVMLTRTPGTGVDLEELVRDELLSQVVAWDQVGIAGPGVALSPKAAEVMTLSVHELATNATKFGAFTRPGGRLSLTWDVEARDGQDWLVLVWKEAGVPIVDAAPRHRGFGAELISRRIAYELKGHGSFELKAGGLESLIEFPLRPGQSILQTVTAP